MNRLEQDAADALTAYERQARHKQGYGPKPPEPLHGTWAPKMTEQEKKEQEQYIKRHSCPF